VNAFCILCGLRYLLFKSFFSASRRIEHRVPLTATDTGKKLPINDAGCYDYSRGSDDAAGLA
jgi:hypothetical protein